MLNIPDIVKNVIKNEYTVKNHRIKFLDIDKADLTNNNLVYDSFSFDESVCSQDQFAFGLSEASCVQFETVDTDDYKIGKILDERIQVSLEYKLTAEQAVQVAEAESTDDDPRTADDYRRDDIGGYWYPIPIGIFYVEEATRNHENMAHRQVVAYSRNERNFNINLAGVYKEDSFAFQPDILVDVASLTPERMETIQYSGTRGGTMTMYDSSWNTYLSLNAGVTRKIFRKTLRPENKVFVVRANYIQDDFDKEQALELLNVALSKLPTIRNSSGNKINFFYDNVNETPTRVFKSTEDSVRVLTGCYQPAIYFQLIDTNHDSAEAYTYPIFIKPNKNIVIDIAQLLTIYKTSGFVSGTITYMYVTIPIRWYSSTSSTPICWIRSWSSTTHDDVYYADFSADWPVDQEHDREGANDISVLFKEYDKTEYGDEYVTIASTLETTKSDLGTYHMFSNAVSTEDLLSGFAEANASFLKQNRNGTFTLTHLDNSNPIQLNDANTVQNAWWDEYDVEDVGKIRYTYTNAAGEEVTTTYSRDSGKKSVYDMTDNFLLKNMLLIPPTATSDPLGVDADITKNYRYTSATRTVDGFTWTKGHVYYYLNEAWHDAGKYNKYATMAKILLEKRFVPYIPEMKFTPLEATFANVPYLEAGDAFAFTAKDGETIVSSYIMRQTISGSQKITSQVECVDGQIISREAEDDE